MNGLHIFIDVMRRGSFAAVARERGVDPSSISRAIAVLEADLGVLLFQRTTRKLNPTEAGALYFTRIEPLLEEMERARENITEINVAPQGTLRMTASVSFAQVCIVPLLSKLRARLPDLKIEMILTDANVDLVGERIDLAVRLGPPLPDSGLIATKLHDTRYRVCVSPEYLQREGSLDVPSALSARRCVLFAFAHFRSRWFFKDKAGEIETVPVDGDLFSNNAVSLRECARAGLGPALLADWLIDADVREGRLIDVFAHYEVTATTFETGAWLLYPSRRYLPLKVRAVIDFFRAHLSPGQADLSI